MSSKRDTPFYMQGNFAPVDGETTAHDLPVSGHLPASLNGLFVRNGPNPRNGDPGHWFLGDGMLHGVRLRDGKAEWYRSRWVHTRYFDDPNVKLVKGMGKVDYTVAKANTHIVAHGGRLLALVESSFPTEVDANLETRETVDFDGKLTTAFTAHPKRCATSGELHFFGYGFRPPFLTYHVLDAGGALVTSTPIELKRSVMMHDFALTSGHVVFLDLPVVLDVAAALLGRRFPFAWSNRHRARLGVLKRGAPGTSIRWFDIPACYVFHVLGAYEQDSRITIDAARYESVWRDSPNDFPPAKLHRWQLDLVSGAVSESQLDDRSIEFPRIDPRREGLPYRYGYAAETDTREMPSRLLRYDLERSKTVSFDFGAGCVPAEPVFVPGESDEEASGWVLTYVYDSARDASNLVVLAADALDAGPLATVELPVRVPFGFHGSYVPVEALSATTAPT